jgi:hypothetical protein
LRNIDTYIGKRARWDALSWFNRGHRWPTTCWHAVRFSAGRPGAARDDSEFPEYDPRDFESEEKQQQEDEEEEEEEGAPGAGGAFAILAGLSMEPDNWGDDDTWTTVGSKQPKKKTAAPTPGPAAAPAPAAPRRPMVPGPRTVAAIPSTAPFPRPTGMPAGLGSASFAGPSRAPYTVTQAPAAAARLPRAPTHDSEGRPLSDTYYQTFQKVCGSLELC